MDILGDMGVSKLSEKDFLKWTTPLITSLTLHFLHESHGPSFEISVIGIAILAVLALPVGLTGL